MKNTAIAVFSLLLLSCLLLSGCKSTAPAGDTETAESDSAQVTSEAPVPVNPEDMLTVMSYNIQVDVTDEARVPHLLEVISTEAPDILGAQECTRYWNVQILNALGENYGRVGEGRDGGNNGEGCSIFYRSDLFELLDSGTKWLSDTPDVVGSVLPVSANVRIMTYAKLKRISDGAEFVCVNTHLDFTDDAIANRQLLVLLSELEKQNCENAVVMGDFNMPHDSLPVKTMAENGFADCGKTAENAENFATYIDETIDYCFVKGNFAAVNYRTDGTRYSDSDPSDHSPVISDLALTK